MTKDWLVIILKRFAKGLLSVAGAFAVQFLVGEIPLFQQELPNVIHSPFLLMIVSGGLLALEKWLQGYRPQ